MSVVTLAQASTIVDTALKKGRDTNCAPLTVAVYFVELDSAELGVSVATSVVALYDSDADTDSTQQFDRRLLHCRPYCQWCGHRADHTCTW